MTNVVVAGVTPATLHFLRYSLGQPTIEVVGIVTSDPREALTYGFAVDSAASPFRGSAAYRDGTLQLAGRYGRGGLRHDHIPLYEELSAALEDGREVDCLVLAENWCEDVPSVGATSVVRLGADVADPVAVAASALADALEGLTPVRHLFVSSIGAGNAGLTARDRLLASRGNRAGAAVIATTSAGTLALDVVENVPARVVVTTTFVTFAAPVDDAAVRRRLRSAGRSALAEVVGQADGPVGALDAVGSPVSILDLGTLQTAGDALSLAFFTDPLAVRTRLASGLVSGSTQPAMWSAPTAIPSS